MTLLTVTPDLLEFPPDLTGDCANRSPRMAPSGIAAAPVAVMVAHPFIRSSRSFTPGSSGTFPCFPSSRPESTLGNHGRACRRDSGDNQRLRRCRPDRPGSPTKGDALVPVPGLRAGFVARAADGSRKHEPVAAMRGHVLQYGETMASCTRQGRGSPYRRTPPAGTRCPADHSGRAHRHP